MSDDGYLKNLFSKARFDSWVNVLTGLGVAGRDKKAGLSLQFEIMTQNEAEALYSGDDIAGKFVDVLPEEMMKKPWKAIVNDEENIEDFDQKMHERFDLLDLDPKILKAMKWGRLYGGAALVVGVDDGLKPTDPLDMKKVRKVNWVQVLHRHELNAHHINYDVRSPYFRQPETYLISTYASHTATQNSTGRAPEATNIEIHRSRVFLFHGAELPDLTFRTNNYWHDSVLNKSKEVIKNYSAAYEGIATLLHDFAQGIFKMKGLSKLISQGKSAVVHERMQLIDAKRSLVKAVVLDADGEDFTRDVTPLTGVDAVLTKFENRLTAASGMPHTRLLGEGATGSLGGGGEAENKDWYDHVARKQEQILKPCLYWLFELFLAESQGLFKKKPVLWDADFESLWEMSDVQKADIRLKTSQADKSDIEIGILDADEVAISRFGSGKYSLDTKLIQERVSEPIIPQDDITTELEGDIDELDSKTEPEKDNPLPL